MPRKRKATIKDVTVGVRMTASEYQLLKRKAEEEVTTVSKFIYRQLFPFIKLAPLLDNVNGPKVLPPEKTEGDNVNELETTFIDPIEDLADLRKETLVNYRGEIIPLEALLTTFHVTIIKLRYLLKTNSLDEIIKQWEDK